MAFPNYSINTDTANSSVKQEDLHTEITALSITATDYRGVSVTGDIITVHFDTTPSTGDQTAVDGAVAAHIGHDALADAKATKNAAIDAKTVSLINQGFSYASKVFSLSTSAQSYWNGLGNLAANGLLTEPDDFPLTVNTLDDSSTYDIASIADAVGVFATAAATVKSRLASGTSLKSSVRAATTVAEVNAVVDNR